MLGLAVKGRLFLAAAGFRYALGTGLSALGINLPYRLSDWTSAAIAAAVYSPPERRTGKTPKRGIYQKPIAQTR